MDTGRDSPGAWRVVLVLTALNVLGYVDRQMIAALSPVLMKELQLSRADIGFLIGPAFIVVFAAGTLLVGAAADRWSRPRIIASGLCVWSLATALTGSAGGFASLVVWRALVGVGEATLPPTAVAIIGDRFRPSRLGFATGVYYAGIPVGFGLSLALAGWVVPRFGWRVCFLALGVLGVAATVLVWRMADPRRPLAAPGAPAGPALRRLREALRAEPSLVLLAVASAALAYTSASSQHLVTWLFEERGLSYSRAAYLASAMVLAAGLAGSLGLGWITDLAARRWARGRLAAFLVLGGLALGSACAFYLLPRASPLFFVAWFIANAWMLGWFAPMMACAHALAPEGSRASVVGFVLMTTNLVGVALGPWITGGLGDRFGLTTGLVSSVGVGFVGLGLVAFVVSKGAADGAQRP